MKDIWYIAVKKFGPANKGYLGWEKYKAWSKLHHLIEAITLDSILCPAVTEIDKEEDWYHIVNEDFMTDFHTDLDYLKLKIVEKTNYNLLGVIREPDNMVRQNELNNFEFIGYDLVGKDTPNSALTNCGGFDETFTPNDLNKFGLIDERDKAFDIRKRLLLNNPNDHHADCWVFEIWREKN